MIVRLFRAVSHPGQEGAYEEHLRRRTAPFLRTQTGCLEVRVARGLPGESPLELLVLTVWDSLDHLRAAAGPTWEEPSLDSEEAAYVASASVSHFEEP